MWGFTWDDENALEVVVSDGSQPYEYTKSQCIIHFSIAIVLSLFWGGGESCGNHMSLVLFG